MFADKLDISRNFFRTNKPLAVPLSLPLHSIFFLLLASLLVDFPTSFLHSLSQYCTAAQSVREPRLQSVMCVSILFVALLSDKQNHVFLLHFGIMKTPPQNLYIYSPKIMETKIFHA